MIENSVQFTAGVDTTLLDRELLVRTTDREVKAFVVVVGVRVVVRADLIVILVVVAALVQGFGDFGGGVVLFDSVKGTLSLVWVGHLTLLPQVTEFWRAPIGPGEASAAAARRMPERMAQRILMNGKCFRGKRWRSERTTGTEVLAGPVGAPKG